MFSLNLKLILNVHTFKNFYSPWLKYRTEVLLAFQLIRTSPRESRIKLYRPETAPALGGFDSTGILKFNFRTIKTFKTT